MNNDFSITIRVTYKDTDQMGVVYYGNFFTWFEMARTEHFRARGIVYKELEQNDCYLPVLSAECTYKKPVSYDDIVVITSRINHIGFSSIGFAYTVSLEGSKVIYAEGETKHCFTNKMGRPVRIPPTLRECIHV